MATIHDMSGNQLRKLSKLRGLSGKDLAEKQCRIILTAMAVCSKA